MGMDAMDAMDAMASCIGFGLHILSSQHQDC